MIQTEIIRHSVLEQSMDDDINLYEAVWRLNTLNPRGEGRENTESAMAAIGWLIEKGWISIIERDGWGTGPIKVLGKAAALKASKEPRSFDVPPETGLQLLYRPTPEGERAYQSGTCCPSNRKAQQEHQ